MQMNCPYCTPTNVWGASPQVMQELLEKHNKSHTLVSGLVASEPYTNDSLANPPKGHTPNTLEEKITSILTTFSGLLNHKSLEARRIAYNGATVALEKLINDTVITELQLLIGTHNNDPSVNRYDVLTIDRALLNKRIAELRTHGAKKQEIITALRDHALYGTPLPTTPEEDND